jgi:excisionase family DNA binding protein
MAATGADAFSQMIEAAVESAMKRVMGMTDISPRRLMKVAEASKYLALSDREIYNMIANKEFTAVKQGWALMLDIRELETWIERKKAKE